ncbi:multiubiquitin domain-containing protein [Chitinophaga pollutisoli]|uniref:Multiubiquitin domain-containing protein n=1 Tax=Chitinophaga pollutisoli TaxID=3133966 RepID=A0ABZ2YR38_9BACT
MNLQERNHEASLKFTIEGKQYSWKEQYITGQQLRNLANLDPDVELYLALQEPWKDEQISPSDSVNLARPDIEHFYVPKKLAYFINDQRFESSSQYITGRQIRKQGMIPPIQDIFLSIPGPWEDEAIEDTTVIDLARPGAERFISREKQREWKIIVNGREKTWQDRKISYDEVVQLAFGQSCDTQTRVHTVTYKRGPHQNPEGTMVKGDIVFIKNKMIFNVTCTDKS